jgi:hypothetical protein
MTEFQVKQAALSRGFDARMHQLMDREIMMRKQALMKYAPRAIGAASHLLGEGAEAGARAFTHRPSFIDVESQLIPEGQKLLGQGGGEAAGGAGGLLGGLWNHPFAAGARNWMGAHPGIMGAAGGAAGMKGFDAYEDSRRREALRQLGIMPRLGLAAQMLFSPERAIKSMNL